MSNMMNFVSLLVFGVSIVQVCEGYGSGAPSVACVSMTPGHLYDHNESRPIFPQDGPSLFSVSLNKDEYEKGEALQVTVAGTTSFIGFFLQARPAGAEKPVGEFSGLGEKMKTVADCSSTYPKGALTHTNQHPDITPWEEGFIVTWTAPEEDVGNITVYATVAQNHDVFWVKVPSDTITYSGFAILSPTLFTLLLPITVVMSRLM